MTNNTINNFSYSIGKRFEDVGEKILLKKGWILHERNYRYRGGEIDRIFFEDETLIFVEIKFRQKYDYQDPESFLSPQQLKRIYKTAEIYMHLHNLSCENRIDSFFGWLDKKKNLRIHHTYGYIGSHDFGL